MASSSAQNLKFVCVFCGSTLGKGDVFAKAAVHLGRVLAKEKLNLVYGGGSQGLMGSLSKSAHENGCKVIGVIPAPIKFLIGPTKGEELVVPGIMERLKEIVTQADAFVVLPGGLGTLEDLFRMTTWGIVNIHQKPVCLLNVDHFFDGLLAFLDRAVELGFITPEARKRIMTANNAEELVWKLRDYKYEPHPGANLIDWSVGGSKKRPLDLSLHL